MIDTLIIIRMIIIIPCQIYNQIMHTTGTTTAISLCVSCHFLTVRLCRLSLLSFADNYHCMLWLWHSVMEGHLPRLLLVFILLAISGFILLISNITSLEVSTTYSGQKCSHRQLICFGKHGFNRNGTKSLHDQDRYIVIGYLPILIQILTASFFLFFFL